jgi:hypothetical protein
MYTFAYNARQHINSPYGRFCHTNNEKNNIALWTDLSRKKGVSAQNGIFDGFLPL